MFSRNLEIKARAVKIQFGTTPGKAFVGIIQELKQIESKLLKPEDYAPEEFSEFQMEAIAQYDRAMDMLNTVVPDRELVNGFLKMPRNNREEIEAYLETWKSKAI